MPRLILLKLRNIVASNLPILISHEVLTAVLAAWINLLTTVAFAWHMLLGCEWHCACSHSAASHLECACDHDEHDGLALHDYSDDDGDTGGGSSEGDSYAPGCVAVTTGKKVNGQPDSVAVMSVVTVCLLDLAWAPSFSTRAPVTDTASRAGPPVALYLQVCALLI